MGEHTLIILLDFMLNPKRQFAAREVKINVISVIFNSYQSKSVLLQNKMIKICTVLSYTSQTPNFILIFLQTIFSIVYQVAMQCQTTDFACV